VGEVVGYEQLLILINNEERLAFAQLHGIQMYEKRKSFESLDGTSKQECMKSTV